MLFFSILCASLKCDFILLNTKGYSLYILLLRYLKVLDVIHVDIHGFPLWVCFIRVCKE